MLFLGVIDGRIEGEGGLSSGTVSTTMSPLENVKRMKKKEQSRPNGSPKCGTKSWIPWAASMDACNSIIRANIKSNEESGRFQNQSKRAWQHRIEFWNETSGSMGLSYKTLGFIKLTIIHRSAMNPITKETVPKPNQKGTSSGTSASNDFGTKPRILWTSLIKH